MNSDQLTFPLDANGCLTTDGTEHEAILPQHIDSTMLSCYRQCPQKFYNEFVLGLRPALLSADLHAGACFSKGLEVAYHAIWREDLKLHDALAKSNAAFELLWGDYEPPKRTSKTKDRVWQAVESYFAEYPPKSDPVQPYFDSAGNPTFEYSFAIPLEVHGAKGFPLHPSGEPFIYCGRLDALGMFHGRPCGRDEKTTRGFQEGWAREWTLRSQFIGYTWAIRQCGIPVESMIIRGIAIQQREIKHLQSEQQYSNFLIERWLEQLRRDLWKLRKSWDEEYFDYNLASACTTYGICPYMDLCESHEPERWYPNFEVRRWNPLIRHTGE